MKSTTKMNNAQLNTELSSEEILPLARKPVKRQLTSPGFFFFISLWISIFRLVDIDVKDITKTGKHPDLIKKAAVEQPE